MRDVIIKRERIDHANTGEGKPLLIFKERNFFGKPQIKRMRTSV